GRDGVEHQRALARTGDPGEDGQAALRNGEADVLEVVDARAVDANQVVTVGRVHLWRLRIRPHGHAQISIRSLGRLRDINRCRSPRSYQFRNVRTRDSPATRRLWRPDLRRGFLSL